MIKAGISELKEKQKKNLYTYLHLVSVLIAKPSTIRQIRFDAD